MATGINFKWCFRHNFSGMLGENALDDEALSCAAKTFTLKSLIQLLNVFLKLIKLFIDVIRS